MNTEIEKFYEIRTINHPEYENHIQVTFVEALDGEPETRTAYEDAACIAVFGDLMPKDLIVEWITPSVLQLHYNIGESAPTKLPYKKVVTEPIIKPPVPNADRLFTIALQDVLQLRDFTDRDMADWLMHFEGYPEETNDIDIEACEREAFIDYDDEIDGTLWDYIVWLWDYDLNKFVGHGFVDEDVAYVYFCKHYNDVREKLGIISTTFDDKDIKWAREYWKALSYEEHYDFYYEAISKHSYWIGVDRNTTFRDYMVISARQSDYEKRHDI